MPRERHGRVFPWLNRSNVYRWLKPWCKSIGVAFTPHMARVEFASRLSEGGQSHTVIADVGTWTDIRVVARYTRTDRCARRDALLLASSPPGQNEQDPACRVGNAAGTDGK
ncbi:MAG: tyrosine-type recombinase/integrase [Rhodospirillales bacterium]|nr:tyrosine-type recombinase/integrase [Rhodospirillales bacterium]